jgi:hypothetical protein
MGRTRWVGGYMTRDFSRLAETSPAAWQQYAGSLTPLFVGR